MGRIGIDVIPDQEFYDMVDKREKEDFFNKLMSASENTMRKTGFSVKSMKKDPPKHTKSKEEPEQKQPKRSSLFRRSNHENGVFDDDRWVSFLDELDQNDKSPIDEVTDHEIHEFGRRAINSLGDVSEQEDDPCTRYDKMFKKEIAMYAEILKDVNAQTRSVAAKLKSLSNGKGQYGISKYYSDMLEQFNSLTKTKVDTIKGMTDLKAKAEDFKLKYIKTDGTEAPDTDELVNQYYNAIMSGGRAEYMSRSLLSQSPYPSDRETYDSIIDGSYDQRDDQSPVPKAGWNITQPIPDQVNQDTGINGDRYGYICNENRQPEICIQRFEDDTLKFIALDKDGLEVVGCELPGDDLLESMVIKPMSNFAYDKFGRKYSIIDITTSGVDLSDLDNPNYEYGDEE